MYLKYLKAAITYEKAVSNFVISADFRTDYSAAAYIAERFGRDGCMACSTDRSQS